jgi:hypothetical protein
MPVAIGHLEAMVLDDDGVVALALDAAVGLGEGEPQRTLNGSASNASHLASLG